MLSQLVLVADLFLSCFHPEVLVAKLVALRRCLFSEDLHPLELQHLCSRDAKKFADLGIDHRTVPLLLCNLDLAQLRLFHFFALLNLIRLKSLDHSLHLRGEDCCLCPLHVHSTILGGQEVFLTGW